MKISISQVVTLNTFSKGNYLMRKEFESNIIPHVGDYIEDSVWEEETEVVNVTINYNDDTCYVTLKELKFDHDRKEILKEHFNMVKLHGWKTIGNVY